MKHNKNSFRSQRVPPALNLEKRFRNARQSPPLPRATHNPPPSPPDSETSRRRPTRTSPLTPPMNRANMAFGWRRDNPLSLIFNFSFSPRYRIIFNNTRGRKGVGAPFSARNSPILFLQLVHCTLQISADRARQWAEAKDVVREGLGVRTCTQEHNC